MQAYAIVLLVPFALGFSGDSYKRPFIRLGVLITAIFCCYGVKRKCQKAFYTVPDTDQSKAVILFLFVVKN